MPVFPVSPAGFGKIMFKKVLIANRGEIAVRIIRACRDMGISPVAVYSEADRASLHVRLADEAYLMGPAPSSESYLSHPQDSRVSPSGAGPTPSIRATVSFRRIPVLPPRVRKPACRSIGPSAESMRLMGSKTGARTVLLKSGVPIVPGTYRALTSLEEALKRPGRSAIRSC